MGVIRNAANQQIRGRVGQTTYYVSEGRQVARQALNNSNYGRSARRSEAQQTNRAKWANLVNFYKVCQTWMPKAFESKVRGVSDYNRLMQVNIPYSDIYLTKNLATIGACVVEDYIISQGSLPSVEITQQTDLWATNIYIGNLAIDNNTTVADFSRALADNNTNIKIGMQLSFVSLQQTVDNQGVPRVICTFYEVTLSEDNTLPLRAYLPDFCTNTISGALATSSNISVGAFAYVISDLRSGRLLVSTQNLITNNATLIAQYSSDRAKREAISSYGVDSEVILSPYTTNEQDATDQPQYISSVTVNGNTYTNGSSLPQIAGWSSPWLINFAKDITDNPVDSIDVIATDNQRESITGWVSSGSKAVSVANTSILSLDSRVSRIEVVLADDTLYLINFTYGSVAGE